MANEISKYYTCVSQSPNVKNNEKVLKKHSLPINLTGSFSSCISFQTNPQRENGIDNKCDNGVINKNIRECSELIMETQEKLQNLKLESYINTFPIDPYSKFVKEEKKINKICLNYTDVISN
eukprot:jgi/Orpsp1_1/1174450/evm.model.c7180000050139.1